MANPKYPKVVAKLVGEDGNAFNLMGIVARKMKSAGVSKEEVSNFLEEAMSGDYNELLVTCMKWVTVE